MNVPRKPRPFLRVAAAVVGFLLLVTLIVIAHHPQYDAHARKAMNGSDPLPGGPVVNESVSSVTTQNPEYAYWSDCGVGSFVETRLSATAAGITGMTTRTALLELTSAKAVVETKGSMEMTGNKIDLPACKREIPATVRQPEPRRDFFASSEGDEEIEVAGTKMLSHRVETSYESNGMKTLSKIWTCARVPGHVCRLESHSDGTMKNDVVMIAVTFEKKQP